jgi:hypothetical protein
VHGGWTSLALRLTLVPGRQFGIFVLTNADMGAQLHAEVTKQALRDYVGIDGLDATPLPVPPADSAQYAGVYRFAGPDEGEFEDAEVQVAGDRSPIRDGRGSLLRAGSHRGAGWTLAAQRSRFLRGTNSAITSLRLGGAWRPSPESHRALHPQRTVCIGNLTTSTCPQILDHTGGGG